MKVAVLVDAEEYVGDCYLEVERSLVDLGHSVEIIRFHPQEIVFLRIFDLVFNLTEGIAGDRSCDAAIASMLEVWGIPFTGTGAKGLLLSRDKKLVKHAALAFGHVMVPATGLTKFPMVVKPRFADGSDFISSKSLVKTWRQLKVRVAYLKKYKQRALVEEYVEGRELSQLVLDGKPLNVVELLKNERAPQLATFEVKWSPKHQARWGVRWVVADLDSHVSSAVSYCSSLLFEHLGLADYAKFEYRLSPQGLYLIEVNPNPNLSEWEVKESGLSHKEIVEGILRSAMRRAANRMSRPTACTV